MFTPKHAKQTMTPALVTLALAAAVTLGLCGIVLGQPEQNRRGEGEAEFKAGEILVAFVPKASGGRINAIRKALGATKIKSFSHLGVQHWQLPPELSVAAAVEKLSGNPEVRFAEPNYLLHAHVEPNDPKFGDLWGLHNTGQTGGLHDADIDAPEAWDIADITNVGSDVVVASIDTGVDYTHRDLIANMWTNPGESGGGRETNGIDDDNNGYIDDVYGINAIIADPDPSKSVPAGDPKDDHDHGTHTSGTMGAVGDNNEGVVGVNWHVKIMALKFLDAWGSGWSDDAIEALNYATMMRTRVNNPVNVVLTNNSWGGGGSSEAMKLAIQASGDAGMLFVASAGNSGSSSKSYPAGYGLPNIIAVAATDQNDDFASWSNYGSSWVHLAAPGVDILSTVRRNKYKSFSGTSMAAPHVAGVAALAWSVAPGASYQMIRDAIFAGVDEYEQQSQWYYRTATHGRLNAFGTLMQLGMKVAASTPADGEIVSPAQPEDPPPTDFVIRFSLPVNPNSLEKTDLLVNDTPADDGVALSDGNLTATFTYLIAPVPSDNVEGLWTMHMGAEAVEADPNAVPPELDPLLEEWDATFRYDTVLLAVLSTDPPPGPTTIDEPFILRVTFNEAYDPDTVRPDDLIVGWPVTVTAARVVDTDTVEYELTGFDDEEPLTVTMPAGAVTDNSGNPNLAWKGTFDLDFDTVGFPTLQYESPLGSLIYDRSISGSISNGDTDSFTIDVDPWQTITVVVDPVNPDPLTSLQPSINVSGPNGSSVNAPGRAQNAVLQTVGPTSAGTYTITVSGVDNTIGAYTLQVILNAAFDAEANDTLDDAQDINNSFVPLAGSGERGGVAGEIENYVRVIAPDFTDISGSGKAELEGEDDKAFNIGKDKKRKIPGWSFDFYGTTYDNLYVSSNGLITFGSANTDWSNGNLYSSPDQAAIAVLWDDLIVSGSNNSAVYWELQGTALIIQWNEVRFYGGVNAGQITFQVILDGTDNSIQFNYDTLDADHGGSGGASATVGIKDVGSQGANRLRLVYNDGPNEYVGTGQSTRIDVPTDVTTPDYYAFTLNQDQSAMLAMSHYGGNADLEFWDGSQWLGATPGPSYNVDEYIEFAGGLPGAYYARLTGDTRVKYNLVVTKDAVFDLQSNFGTPPPWSGGPFQTLDIGVDGRAVVLGQVWSTGTIEDPAVLYFQDDGHSDPFLEALAALDITPTVAGSYDDFVDKLRSGGWDLVVLLCQNDANTVWVDPMVDWVRGGGRAIVTDWTRNAKVAAAFGGAYTGAVNGASITQTVGHPIWEGVPDPLELSDPGWNVFSMGLTATTGTAIGTFPNGDAALIVGAGGRTVLNGFMSDAADAAITIAAGESTIPVEPERDFYAIELLDGDVLDVRTSTPADGDGEFYNDMDPMIEVYVYDDPTGSGIMVASDDNSDPDGRNARLTYDITATDTYYVAVRTTDALTPPGETATSGGEYVLSVDLNAGPECGSDGDCDDLDACTDDTCNAGVCSNVPKDCDDADPCTDDSCNSGVCVHTDNTAPCDDDDACTTNDTCAVGACVGGPPPNCDDANVCTDDSCDSVTGCEYINNSNSCNDGDACTTDDTCEGGACVGGPPPACDDGDDCTNDSCDPGSGCVNTPIPGCGCSPIGDTCTDNSDCCSNKCKGKRGSKICKR